MNIKFTTGNFDLAINSEFNEDQKEARLEEALRYIVQRDVASPSWKELLPDKTAKRDSLEFSDDAASKIVATFEKNMEKYGDFSVIATEHVESETAPAGKMAQGLWAKVKASGDASLLGLDSVDDDEAGLAAAREFFAGLKNKKE